MLGKTVIAVLAVLLQVAAAAAAPRAGDVVRVRGRAEVSAPGRAEPARPGLELYEDDQVRTAATARVKMLFRDDSVLTLGPESLLKVKKYLYNPENRRADSVCELLDGRLRSVVGRASYRVVTPTAYAAARGTVFVVWYDPDRRLTGVAVLEGRVEVGGAGAGAGEAVMLSAGQMTMVAAGRAPGRPEGFETIGPEVIDAAGSRFDFRLGRVPEAGAPVQAQAAPWAGFELAAGVSLPPFAVPPAAGDQATAVGMTLNFP